MKAAAVLLTLGLLAAALPAVKYAADSARRQAAAPQAAPVVAAAPHPQPPPPAVNAPAQAQQAPPAQQWWVYRGGFGARPGVHTLYVKDPNTGQPVKNIDPKGDFWVGPFPDFASANAAYLNTYMRQQGGSFGP